MINRLISVNVFIL